MMICSRFGSLRDGLDYVGGYFSEVSFVLSYFPQLEKWEYVQFCGSIVVCFFKIANGDEYSYFSPGLLFVLFLFPNGPRIHPRLIHPSFFH